MLDSATGAVIGSGVGDALGVPFEFGPEGAWDAEDLARLTRALLTTPSAPPP